MTRLNSSPKRVNRDTFIKASFISGTKRKNGQAQTRIATIKLKQGYL